MNVYDPKEIPCIYLRVLANNIKWTADRSLGSTVLINTIVRNEPIVLICNRKRKNVFAFSCPDNGFINNLRNDSVIRGF